MNTWRPEAPPPVVAYFSMEVGIEPEIPTYSGGLGVLAGDVLRAAADLGLPMAGVSLIHRKGYFRQELDALGSQRESPAIWAPEEHLEALAPRVTVLVEDRTVLVRAWRYRVVGVSGFEVPLYLLDTDLPENAPEDRALTDHLYGGDDRYRLGQEAVLGLGGIAILRALGHHSIHTFHMNEGHSALLGLALLEDTRGGGADEWPTEQDVDAVRSRCVFTTHTPVPAGHDRFPISLVRRVLGNERADLLEHAGGFQQGELNMTHLALHLSHFLNGVAMRHREVTRDMFPNAPVDAITNGVHARTWTSPPFRALFDRYIPEWRRESLNLRYTIGIPVEKIRRAHRHAKRALLDEVETRTGVLLDPAVFTIGFARRAAVYKRAYLLFTDLERLRAIHRLGPLQIIFAGKAHPRDEAGKDIIRRIHQAAGELAGDVRVIYLENYDMRLAAQLCAGVDLWLNTPQSPEEASGTSGMKAALNGVPSLSVLDGWWIEGHVEGVTGWSIGERWRAEPDAATDTESLYRKLEQIVPMFYGDPDAYGRIMRSAIALNGSFFNAERMVFQYATGAYRMAAHASWGVAGTLIHASRA